MTTPLDRTAHAVVRLGRAAQVHRARARAGDGPDRGQPPLPVGVARWTVPQPAEPTWAVVSNRSDSGSETMPARPGPASGSSGWPAAGRLVDGPQAAPVRPVVPVGRPGAAQTSGDELHAPLSSLRQELGTERDKRATGEQRCATSRAIQDATTTATRSGGATSRATNLRHERDRTHRDR